ncbi:MULTISPECIES: methyl-accepting chemotaxis protein [unclassified Herbaspirillum]|uniref:methyl-accepting chemotaxis protein n=1 Tax=unclassified Herbaspirillum TaxID=2624150 RepID=UPI000E2FA5D5|nr:MULTISPECIES: methyl-accepting chemotaxis protein [unclassified Herbaspirillum]RFB70633.1 HAMP domain-containing protein [Herbaspirillum sp. 3R-3a1]TFI08845.1 HAMP domain-containing protein [Herbaspirillum sp. 3R11]TFI15262.1 HAMP domain-containing protein [Herbaspirillum sp. 3R-11]TFI27403.1 HAMP domain-containing protein [Herbaspirillum sp. 3C11]
MRIANFKIGARLGLGFGFLVLLLVAMAVLGVTRLSGLNEQMDEVINDKYPKTVLANDIIKNVNVIARSSRNVLLMTDADEVGKEMQTIRTASDNTKTTLEKLDSLITGDKGRALMKSIMDARTQYNVGRDEVLRLVVSGAKNEATVLLLQTVRPLQLTYMSAVETLIAHQNELMHVASKEVEEEYREARNLVIALSAIALVFAGLIAWLVTRSITSPLSRAVKVAETVAAGDLTSQFDASGKDETGQLLRALRSMNDNLLDIVSRVRHGTDTIATASTQIAAGNLDLSSRTEQQASSLEETASSMEELTSTVKQNAENAREANKLAVSASAVAVEGGNVVGKVVHTMESINASSRKIVDIISVIDGIAFQTNILALNAAVEAARAGEQGRGFAVVASEVRTLAQRSAAAAKEIKSLIDDSVEKVDSGSKLVEQAGQTMNEVVSSVRRVTDIVGEITEASREQSEGIEQVNQAVTQMDQVTQQNAALVEEAAAAAQSLQDQATSLSQIVGVFKIDSNRLPNNAGVSPSAQQRSRDVTPKTPSLARKQEAPRLPAAARTPVTTKEDDWEQF